MAHRYTNILIHYVFITKNRQNLIPLNLQPTLGNISQESGATTACLFSLREESPIMLTC
jgi:hypothetical protein